MANETYEGSPADREFISSYLTALRLLPPTDLFLHPDTVNLADVLTYRSDILDAGMFLSVVGDVATGISNKYSCNFRLIPFHRYWVSVPENEDTGGFHSEGSLGFNHTYDLGIGRLLNPRNVPKGLATLELARSFLHDCFHAETYRTFRRTKLRPTTSAESKHFAPKIYRAQYGINFRNAKGLSYSSPTLTERVPDAINLNLLMDGIGVLVLSEMFSDLAFVQRYICMFADEAMKEDLSQVHIAAHSYPSIGTDFFRDVTRPTIIFLDHWGRKEFAPLIIRAMFTGKLEDLITAFEDRAGSPGAWARTFRQEGFAVDDP